jgi:hypothetical protein
VLGTPKGVDEDSADMIVSACSDALNDVKNVFVKTVLRDQDCFREERGWDTLLALIPDKGKYCSCYDGLW